MSITQTELSRYVLESHKLPIGNLYFFENLIISEINEGMHFSFDTAKDYVSLIIKFYGTQKPFGYISNRINGFSLDALDFIKFDSYLPNLKLFTSVYYNEVSLKNIDFEKQFCRIPYFKLKNISEAYNYVNNYVLNKSTTIA